MQYLLFRAQEIPFATVLPSLCQKGPFWEATFGAAETLRHCPSSQIRSNTTLTLNTISLGPIMLWSRRSKFKQAGYDGTNEPQLNESFSELVAPKEVSQQGFGP